MSGLGLGEHRGVSPTRYYASAAGLRLDARLSYFRARILSQGAIGLLETFLPGAREFVARRVRLAALSSDS